MCRGREVRASGPNREECGKEMMDETRLECRSGILTMKGLDVEVAMGVLSEMTQMEEQR